MTGPGTLSKRALPSLGRTVVLSESFALPIAIFMMSLHPERWSDTLLQVSLVAQTIGLLCRAAVGLCWDELERMSARRAQAVVLGLFFLSGVAGLEIAARAYTTARHFRWDARNHLSSLLVSASMTVLAGVVLSTLARARSSLEETQRALHERQLAEAELRRAKSEAELSALRARMNPHFLFNTLNSIAALVREDPAAAEAVTTRLSSLLRYVLQASTRPLVTLEEELEVVRRYLEIEQVRLGERLSYEIAVDPALAACEVPALLLQPLVENAIKHGIAPRAAGGALRIGGWREEERTVFTVRNTGDGIRAGAGGGEGLENVRRRLSAMYGEAASVSLTADGGETETRVVLPAPSSRP